MPWIAAGAAIGGAALGASSAGGQQKKSVRFQREMAKNAHQYEVADLREAGLNPILSGTGGPGARASGGASAPIPDFANSAKAAVRLGAEIQLLNEQSRKAQYEADINAPAALIGRAVENTVDKTVKGVKKYRYIFPTGQEAIRLQDQKTPSQRTPFKGFKKTLKPRTQRRAGRR